MNFSTLTSVFHSVLSFFVVFLLLFSFGLHSMQFPHSHPGQQDHSSGSHQDKNGHTSGSLSELSVYMHAAEKKLFLMIASVWSFATPPVVFLHTEWILILMVLHMLVATSLRQNRRLQYLFNDYLTVFFSRGILNPKPY